MEHKLPAEILVEPLDGGVRLVLPQRSLGTVRSLGRWLMFGALAVLAIPLASVWPFVAPLFANQGGVPGVFAAAVMLFFLVPSVLFAKLLFFIGLSLAYGHAEIAIYDGKLWAIEHCGGWRRRWSRPLNEVTRLAVAGGIGGQNSPKLLGDVAAIRAGNHAASIWLVPGYSRTLCEALVEVVRERIAAAGAPSVVVTGPEPLVSLQPPKQIPPVERPVQPQGSKVVLESLPNGVTLDVPALGLRGGSMALVVVGGFWSGCCSLLAVAGVAQNGIPSLPGFVAFMLVDAIGVALIVLGVLNSRRRAGLAVVDGELMVLQTGIRRLERRWAPGEVKSVAVGPSNVEVNDQPVLELQIVDAAGRKCGLLGGRNVPELEWIATVLRGALAQGASEPEPATESTGSEP